METTLPDPITDATFSAPSSVGDEIASDFTELPKRSRRRLRNAHTMEEFKVLRAVVRDRRLRATAVMVFTALRYIRDGDVPFERIASWLCIHRSNVSRAVKKLQRLGLVDAEYKVVPNFEALLQHKTKGFFKVTHVDIVTLGLRAALVRGGVVAFEGRFNIAKEGRRFEVPARALGVHVGMAPRTALRLLYRLGVTRLEIERNAGHGAFVRILAERDWIKPVRPISQKPLPKPIQPIGGLPLAPSTDEYVAMIERLKHEAPLKTLREQEIRSSVVAAQRQERIAAALGVSPQAP